MAAQEAELELLGELLRDVRGHEAAEARVDAVGVLALDAVDELARRRASALSPTSASSAAAPSTATAHTSASVRSSPVRTIVPVTPRV